MAMTGLIPLNWDHPIPPIDPPEPFGKYIADYIEFTQPQKHIEDALVVARGGKKR